MRHIAALIAAVGLLATASTASADDVIDHEPFGQLLETYVDADGQVAYAQWKQNDGDLEKLRSYVDSIAEAEPEGHSDEAKLAFYLNAYNAHVLAAILDHWPTDSPQSIKGFFKVHKREVAGRAMTLDHLEHKLIRKKFDEPRIHFVLVCAAKACPRLRTSPLTESNLDASLSEAAGEFIPRVTELNDGKVVTSQLFNWFASDFEEAAGSVREYLAEYTDGDVKEALQKEEVEVTFREYDWSINKQ
ncbi:MAG: DUF547 domain-containing protein [Bradymonadaceae bacterium]